MIVLDSSAAVDYLVRLRSGDWVAEQILRDDDLHAPHLFDVEVVNVLRRLARSHLVPVRECREAVEDLLALDLARYPHGPFLARIWELRNGLTAYDAAFVALSEALEATLVTTDVRLARTARRFVRVAVPA